MALDYRNHRLILHALTEWDQRQEKRDRHHNPHFLGLAIGALEEAEKDSDDPRTVIVRCFNGRCCDFILKSMGLATRTKAEWR